MGIKFVQLIHAVSVGGDHGDINYWSRDKHGKDIEVVEKGPWLIMTTRQGERRRVPMTNVVSIAEEGEEPAKEQKK